MKQVIMAATSIVLGVLVLISEVGKNPLNKAVEYFSTDYGTEGEAICLNADNELTEKFYSDRDDILAGLAFRSVTWNNKFRKDAYIYIDIWDSQKLVWKDSIPAKKLLNNDMTYLYPDIQLTKDTWYKVDFKTNIDSTSDSKCAIMSGPSTDKKRSYLLSDERADLCMSLYIRKAPTNG